MSAARSAHKKPLEFSILQQKTSSEGIETLRNSRKRRRMKSPHKGRPRIIYSKYLAWSHHKYKMDGGISLREESQNPVSHWI
jgi:hypothetical protein